MSQDTSELIILWKIVYGIMNVKVSISLTESRFDSLVSSEDVLKITRRFHHERRRIAVSPGPS